MSGRRWRLPTERTSAIVAVVAVVAILLWHGLRAAASGWIPTGDDAYFTLRSLDVLGEHHPLLGAWSAGSVDLDRHVNNLGPMQLDLLAPFTKVAWAGGTALGVVVVHALAVLSIAWLSYRLGGARQVVASMAGVALLSWMMGSLLLITPQQHQYLLPTYLAALVAAWCAAAGDRWAPLVFVVAGSLALQTHLTYPILIVPLALTVVVGQAIVWRTRPEARSTFVTAWGVTIGLGVLLWIQTAIDQFFGQGNVTDVLTAPSQAESPGLVTGARLSADVLVSRRGYLRPGLADFDPSASTGSRLETVALLVLWLALVGLATLAIRHGRHRRGAGFAVAAVAIAAAVVNAALIPESEFFGLRPESYRWLWPTAALLVLGAASLAVRRRFGVVVCLALVLSWSVLNVPRSYQVAQPDGFVASEQAVADVVEQLLDRLPAMDLDGPVVVVQSEMYLGHRFAYPLGIVVRELGLDYRYEGAGQARRFGADRVADGSEPTRLVLRHGDAAAARFDAPDTVAYAAGAVPVSVTLEQDGTP